MTVQPVRRPTQPPFEIPPSLQSPLPLGGGGRHHFPQKAYRILGTEEAFSLGYIGTAAILVLPFCGAIPPPQGGNHHFMTVPLLRGNRHNIRGEISRRGRGSLTCPLACPSGGPHRTLRHRTLRAETNPLFCNQPPYATTSWTVISACLPPLAVSPRENSLQCVC